MGYREINALNQSILKKIFISPQSFLQASKKQEFEEEEIKEHFVFGSVLDIMLTGNKQEFDSKFLKVPDKNKCSDSIKKIVDDAFLELEDKSLAVDSDEMKLLILKYCEFNDYQSKWKPETKVNKVIEEAGDYFEQLKTLEGKIPVTESDYAKAVMCVIALKSNEFTEKYTNPRLSKDECEFLNKFIIQFEFQGLKIKGELDRVIINHTEKTITPIDFKSTGKSIYGFINDFWYYRYDFQAAVYTRGLFEHPDIRKLLENNYSLNPFLYIAVESNLIGPPMVFEVTPEAIEIGFSGGIVNKKTYEGFEQAIARYKYAQENDRWEYPMEYYESGKMLITV